MNKYSHEFFELSNDLLCVCDFQGRFLQVNDSWERILGWPKDRFLKNDPMTLVHPADVSFTQQELLTLASGKTTLTFENRILSCDHKYHNFLWNFSSDPDRQLIFGVARDITDLKEKEKALEEDYKRLQQILNGIDNFILLKDLDSRLLFANKAFREFYGFGPDQDISILVDKAGNDPALTKKYLIDDQYVIQTKSQLVIPWEHSTRADGVLRKVRVTKTPIFDDKGNVTMTLGVSKDVTEELEKEEIIADQQAKMIHAARMSSLGEMAAGVAHEINNPLTIIDAILFSARSRLVRQQLQADDLTSAFDRIEKATHRIARIVKSLRFFSRNTENDPLSIASLNVILQDTLELCREKFKFGRVDLRIPDVGDLKISCRPTEIGQVLLNLITNSFDAVAGTEKAWVSVEVTEIEGRVYIQVTDSGNGIPKSIQEKMINPFFTTKEVGHGTGLGLSIAMGIVNSHGGKLNYDDHSGHTRFTFDVAPAPPP